MSPAGGSFQRKEQIRKATMTDRDVDLFKLSDKLFAQRDRFEQLSEPERVFLCVWELEAEVNNGGFHQYYFNSAGDHAQEVSHALETIGAPQTASIVRQANALFGPSGPSPDHFIRQNQLLAIGSAAEDQMVKLDEEFYGYPPPEVLKDLLEPYVRHHAEAFRWRWRDCWSLYLRRFRMTLRRASASIRTR